MGDNMSRKDNHNFTDLVDSGIVAYSDSIIIPTEDLINIVKTPLVRSKINKIETEFEEFLYSIYDIHYASKDVIYLTTYLSDSYNYKLVVSYNYFMVCILRMLNMFEIDNGTPEVDFSINSAELTKMLEDKEKMHNQLTELKNIKNETELREKFPFLYYGVFKPGAERASKYNAFKMEYMLSRNNPSKFKKFKKNYGILTDERADSLFKIAKGFSNFDIFREQTHDFLASIVESKDKIKKWILDNPINLELPIDDAKKVSMYILWIHFGELYINVERGNAVSALRDYAILEKLIEKYKKNYPNDNSEMIFDSIQLKVYFDLPENSKQVCSLSELSRALEKVLNKNQFLKKEISIPEIDKNLSVDENLKKVDSYLIDVLINIINEEREHGAKDVTEEVHHKLEQLEAEIKSNTLNDKEKREKAIVLKKLNMVLNDIKPKAIQTGTGRVFKNYYVYYYDNGMVAVDRIDGYGALYIMPVNIYKEARYKDRLGNVKNIPGVKSVSHKNKDWLNIAKNYIMTGTEGLTEKDMKDAEEVASIDFPYTLEELDRLQKQLEEEGKFSKSIEEETKRRAKKIKKLEDIDTELTSNEFNNYSELPEEKREKIELLDGAQDEVLYSDEIEEAASSDKSFDELYEDWKKHNEVKKKTRNPVVAGITKRRSMNENGKYCCEWCGDEYTDTRPLRSHHVIALGKGGPDNIYNTVCICPNCHDYVHSHEMTYDQQYRLFEIIRKHLEDENPEYLPNFYRMTSPVVDSKEEYEQNKELNDYNFRVQWSAGNIVRKKM